MSKPRLNRFLDDKPGLVADVLKNAEDYWHKADDANRHYIRVKPYSGGPDYAPFFASYHRFLLMVEAANLAPHSRILDVGVGTGWTSEILARMGYKVIGIEPSPECLQIARERSGGYPLGPFPGIPLALEYFQGDFFDFPEPEKPFDAVFFFDSLHHLEHERELFAKMRRMVRMGGVLGISEGAPPAPGSKPEAESLQQMRDFGVLENPFYPEYLDELLVEFGFPEFERMVPVSANFSFGQLHHGRLSEYLGQYAVENVILAYRSDFTGKSSAQSESIRYAMKVERVESGFAVTLENVGAEKWNRGGFGQTGEVFLAMHLIDHSGNSREYTQRFPLLVNVYPGQKTEMRVEISRAALEGVREVAFDLVCERRFWGANVGNKLGVAAV